MRVPLEQSACICYGPIANSWPACKRADPIVSRPAGVQAGQLAIEGQEAGRCGLKAGRARRTAWCISFLRTSLGLGSETQHIYSMLALYSKLVTVSFGAR